MINNDLGFTLAEGLPFTAYDKVIEGNRKLSVVPMFRSIGITVYSDDEAEDASIHKDYMFSFTEAPTDEDVSNMFKFINDYFIPYFNNPCDETGDIMDEKRKEFFPNLRVTTCFHNN
jgi:hypothetical protein